MNDAEAVRDPAKNGDPAAPGSPAAVCDPLSPRELRVTGRRGRGKNGKISTVNDTFALLVASGDHLGEAYLQSRPGSVANRATANKEAARLASDPLIAARVDWYRSRMVKKLVMQAAERKERLSDIARADMTDFLTPDGDVLLSKAIPHHSAVSEYRVDIINNGKDNPPILRKVIKLRDPVPCIGELNRMDGIGRDGDRQEPPVIAPTFVFVLPDGTRIGAREMYQRCALPEGADGHG